jgi:hypothetical protein
MLLVSVGSQVYQEDVGRLMCIVPYSAPNPGSDCSIPNV